MDYSGSFLYENNILKCIFTSAGRILVFTDNGSVLYKFEYNLQDHLGNTRVVFGGHNSGKTELIQQTDYYPFGLVMAQKEYIAYEDIPGHEVLKNKNLYNGKEWQDDEIGGVKLDWYDYGFRFYDPQLARFIGIDPASEQFVWVTPYNYAENSPIANIDLWGLQAFCIHGLQSSSADWQKEGFQRVKETLVGLTNNKTVNSGFDWSRDASAINVTSQRTKAANALVEYIKLNNVKGEDVTLIGVSHGGNVAIQAAGILGEKGIKVNVITVNTPAENNPKDVENPNSIEGINDMIQITTEGDWVAGGLSTEDRTYNKKPTKHERQELELKNNAKWYQPMKIHGTENVDTKQIRNSNLRKLKSIDDEHRLK